MRKQKNQRLKIKIKNSQRKIIINKKNLTYLAKRILRIKGQVHAELSILFAGKVAMRKLNKKYRGVDRACDVLAFSQREGKGVGVYHQALGDIVICPEMAQRFAKIYKSTIKKEFCLYLIHGILHLLGYDDTNAKSRILMEREEQRIFNMVSS